MKAFLHEHIWEITGKAWGCVMGTYPLKEKPGAGTLAYPRASQWGLPSLQGQEGKEQENIQQALSLANPTLVHSNGVWNF